MQFDIPVLAITGSNGKTTTKELIAKVLSEKYKVLSTTGNLNNHIGVPLTLLQINKEHEIAVIEMGANHRNEIKLLCETARPNHGIITNLGKAHLEGFGNIQGVIDTKNELYDYLKSENGVIFINYNNAFTKNLSSGCTNAYTFSSHAGTDIFGEQIESDLFLKAKYISNLSEHEDVLESQLFGAYNLDNVLASVCIGEYFDVPSDKIKSAVENYKPDNNRSQVITKGSIVIILDAYNANPSSMEPSIIEFAKTKFKNKILILGDMLELGEEFSKREHENIIRLLNKYEFKNIIYTGNEFAKVVSDKSLCFNNVQETASYLSGNTYKDSCFFIKGSRDLGLEKLVNAINC
jgi:UDP-N-acetylmuramoyl-tripeptide--D-alanyl-D-alanine ligase